MFFIPVFSMTLQLLFQAAFCFCFSTSLCCWNNLHCFSICHFMLVLAIYLSSEASKKIKGKQTNLLEFAKTRWVKNELCICLTQKSSKLLEVKTDDPETVSYLRKLHLKRGKFPCGGGSKEERRKKSHHSLQTIIRNSCKLSGSILATVSSHKIPTFTIFCSITREINMSSIKTLRL